MNGKKILIAALSSTLLVGAAATATLAAPGDDNARMGHHHHGKMHHGRDGRQAWHHMGPPPEVIFVRIVKQFDTNGDMKVSKDEFTAGVDKIFDQIDTNHDGQITPAELKTYRQDKMKAWREERQKDMAQNAAQNNDQGAKKPDANKPDDGDQAQNGQGMEHHGRNGGHGQRGHWMREARMMQMMMFARVDTDSSGQISKPEAEAFANKIFDRMDRNHDGVISIDDMPSHPFF
jgi:hypothetical protein